MEVERIIYKAKDGRIFFDPIECQDYEKTIGVLQGSVGALVKELDEHDGKEYIFGIVFVRDGDEKSLYTRYTACQDHLLEDWVNVKNLNQEQRYSVSTVGELRETLRQLNQDLPCHYMIAFSDNIDFKRPGCMANYNRDAWGSNSDKK